MVIGSLLGNKLNHELWLVKPTALVTISNSLKLELTEPELTKLVAVERDPDTICERYCDIPLEQVGNKLIVSISGMMIPEGNWIATYFGYVGMNGFNNIIKDAITDPSIDHVIFKWNCTGSTVQGIYEVAANLNELRKCKRTTSLCVGDMCSGAYLSGSTVDEIFSNTRVNDIGSIGVVSMHIDYSRRLENEGIKVTYLQAGKYKTMGNPYEPLTEEAKNELMQGINFVYQEFKNTVQLNRNLSEEELNKVTEGRIFTAEQAVDNKLIDGIKTIDEILTTEA